MSAGVDEGRDVQGEEHDPHRAGPEPRPRRTSRVPRHTLWAGLAGVVVALVVTSVIAVLPTDYQARVGLLALPVGIEAQVPLQTAGVATSYGEVVTLAIPSVGDVAVSPSVLDAVRAEVDGAPDTDTLAGAIEVEVVPSSGVARLAVTAEDPTIAARLAEALSRKVIEADLLAPAGQLRTLDDQASVTPQGFGLGAAVLVGLLAGLVVAVVIAAWLRPFRPRPAPAISELLVTAGRPPAPVLDGADPALNDRVRVLARASGRPIRSVPASPGAEGAASALAAETAREPVAWDAACSEPAVLLVMEHVAVRRAAPDEGLATVRALPTTAPVLAVVLV